jgi:hypothetical protein
MGGLRPADSAELREPNGPYKRSAGPLSDVRLLIAGSSDHRHWQGTMNTAEIFNFGADPEAEQA